MTSALGETSIILHKKLYVNVTFLSKQLLRSIYYYVFSSYAMKLPTADETY